MHLGIYFKSASLKYIYILFLRGTIVVTAHFKLRFLWLKPCIDPFDKEWETTFFFFLTCVRNCRCWRFQRCLALQTCVTQLRCKGDRGKHVKSSICLLNEILHNIHIHYFLFTGYLLKKRIAKNVFFFTFYFFIPSQKNKDNYIFPLPYLNKIQ